MTYRSSAPTSPGSARSTGSGTCFPFPFGSPGVGRSPSSGWLRSILTAGALALAAGPAAAELHLGLFLGTSHVARSDLRVVLPDDTDAVLRDVGWRSAPFEDPPYFVVRASYWLPRSPAWGVGLDFTHAKAFLEREVVEVSGRVAGEPFAGLRPTTDFVRRLEMAHGLNTLTANLMVRRPSVPAEGFGTSRLGLYAALGAGVAMPRVEAHRPEAVTRRFQLTGPALQGVLGTDIPIDEVFSILVEYKASWIDLDMDLVGGGRLATCPWVHQLAFGLGIGQ